MSLADRGMKLPVTLGHENVGEVVAFGPDAKGVKVGDRRLAHPWIGCGTCGPCQRGEENLCRAMRSLGVFSQRRLRRLPDGAASALSVRYRRPAARTRSAARLFGRHDLRRPEKNSDAEKRADGDHRRRRSRAHVPCLAQGDGRPQRHRGRHRSGEARGREEGRCRSSRRWRRGRCVTADHRHDQWRRLGRDRSRRLVAERARRLSTA